MATSFLCTAKKKKYGTLQLTQPIKLPCRHLSDSNQPTDLARPYIMLGIFLPFSWVFWFIFKRTLQAIILGTSINCQPSLVNCQITVKHEKEKAFFWRHKHWIYSVVALYIL